MRYIFLDDVGGFLSWLPYAFPLSVGVISYFFKAYQLREKERVDKIESDNENDHKILMEYIKNLEKADEEIRKTLNDVNIQILKDINALTVKLAEYKRDIRN